MNDKYFIPIVETTGNVQIGINLFFIKKAEHKFGLNIYRIWRDSFVLQIKKPLKLPSISPYCSPTEARQQFSECHHS